MIHVDDAGTNWYQVKTDSSTGWVMARYLITAAKPAAKPAPAKAASAPALLAPSSNSWIMCAARHSISPLQP